MSKFVLVTGASSGIGQAAVECLIQRGFTVFSGVRKQADAQQIEQKWNGRAIPLIIDLTMPETISSARQQVQRLAGQKGLVGLINNAGIVVAGPMESLSLDEIRHQFEVNVFGQISVSQAFVELLRQSGDGRLIQISSVSGLMAFPMVGPYAGSKFALEAICDSFRMELRKTGIQVVLIEPGVVTTAIWQKTSNLRGSVVNDSVQDSRYRQLLASVLEMQHSSRPSSPQHVAKVIHKALTARNPKPRYQVGWDSRLAIVLRVFPSRTRDWMIRYALRRSAKRLRDPQHDFRLSADSSETKKQEQRNLSTRQTSGC